MEEDNGNISQISFSESDISFVTSTPQKQRRAPSRRRNPASAKRTQPQSTSAFAVPCAVLKCPQCSKVYKTQRYYKQHMVSHKIQEAWSLVPDAKFLTENRSVICMRALKKISECISFGESGQKFKYLVQCVEGATSSDEWDQFTTKICEIYASSIKTKRFLLPSAMWANIFKSMESLLSCKTTRECLEQLLCSLINNNNNEHSESAVLQIFICDMIMYSGEEVLTFIKDSIIGTRQETVPQFCFDSEDRQTIHYIGGSIMHKFRRLGKRYSQKKEWQEILNIIATRIDSSSSSVEPPSDSDKEWTAEVNRGGLFIIGAKFMNVLMGLAAVVRKCVKPNASLSHEKVLQATFSSPVPVIWDDLIGCDNMDEDLSLRFFQGVVKSFSQTYSRGLLKMKLNEVHEKPYTSLNLRHSVAPKS